MLGAPWVAGMASDARSAPGSFAGGLHFVESSVMAAAMAVAADGAHHVPSDCDRGRGGEHENAATGICLSGCGSANQDLLPGDPVAPASSSRTGLQHADLLIIGQSTTPPHGPPKIVDALGLAQGPRSCCDDWSSGGRGLILP